MMEIHICSSNSTMTFKVCRRDLINARQYSVGGERGA